MKQIFFTPGFISIMALVSFSQPGKNCFTTQFNKDATTLDAKNAFVPGYLYNGNSKKLLQAPNCHTTTSGCPVIEANASSNKSTQSGYWRKFNNRNYIEIIFAHINN